jgi:hypothetical protein
MLKLLIIYVASSFVNPCIEDNRQDTSFRQPVVHVTAEACSVVNQLASFGHMVSKACNESTESESTFDLNQDWIPEEEVCSGKRGEA